MPKQDLEATLTALTQEFVGRLVQAIRNASFAEVAALPTPRAAASPPRTRTDGRKRVEGANQTHNAAEPGRQTAARRAELSERVVQVKNLRRRFNLSLSATKCSTKSGERD